MRAYVATLMLLSALAALAAALLAPGDLASLQREPARAYRVEGAQSPFARIDVDLSSRADTLTLRCNGANRQRCPAQALQVALAWQPELTLWHDGRQIRQLRLNGNVVYAYERHGRWQRPLAIGLALLCALTGAALVAFGWLAERRRREWEEQAGDWHATRMG
jgi:hypothetical protein